MRRTLFAIVALSSLLAVACSSSPETTDQSALAEESTESADDIEPTGDTTRFLQSLIGYSYDNPEGLPACETTWEAYAGRGWLAEGDEWTRVLYCRQYDEVGPGFQTGALMLFSVDNRIRTGILSPTTERDLSSTDIVERAAESVEAVCERTSVTEIDERIDEAEFQCPHAEVVIGHGQGGALVHFVPDRRLMFDLRMFGFESGLDGLRETDGFDNRETGLRPTEGDEVGRSAPEAGRETAEEDTEPQRERLTRRDVTSTIENARPAVDDCARDRDADEPAGNAMIRFEVAPSGEVTSARARSDFEKTEIGACLAEVFESMTFPPTREESKRIIHYPVTVRAELAEPEETE